MNELDSQRLAGHFVQAGWEIALSEQNADLVILNTCSVREKAEEKIFAYLGRLKQWKSAAPSRRIVVAGCVAQQYRDSLLNRAPHVDLVIGPAQIDHILNHLETLDPLASTHLSDDITYDYETIYRSGTHTALLTVIEGCNMFCSFCIVPYTRGRERSRPVESILTEIHALVESNRTDIMLLGQTINAYQCPETGTNFDGLLERAARVPGLKCLKFVTSHPKLFTQDMIDTVAGHPNISRYLHLPVQSGSNAILTRMNRKYTRNEYLDLLSRLRDKIPDAVLSSDMIVGFPGETEEDHEQTLDLIQKARFATLFAFKYSPRRGTTAAKVNDDVAPEIKDKRLADVIRIQDEIQAEINQALVGTTLTVLVEGQSRKDPSRWSGRSHCNRVVNLVDINSDIGPGSWIDVEITRAHAHSLSGRRVPQNR